MVMPGLNIEIRKIGNLPELYKQVDIVLDKAKNIEMHTIAHGLQHMFRSDRYLDVCFVRQASELCNIVIPRERMLVYGAVHCVSWNEMTPEYRNLIMAMILDDFRPIFCNVADFKEVK